MKTNRYILSLLILFLGFNSCIDEYTEVFTANSPVYMSYDELRDAVKMSTATELVNPGKIYFKDGYIFINEELKGIHVIDNRNPQNPQNIGFIDVPGNMDLAVKGDILYADSYIDLVAIDISNITSPKEVNRIKKIFPYTTPPLADEDFRMAKVDEDQGVVIDWEIKKVKQEMDYHYYPQYVVRYEYAMADMAYSNGAVQGGNSFGVGGSMARFGLYSDYLYAVDDANLYIFDVKNPESPNSIGKQNVGWNVETMFIYDAHMFLGTQTGMRIYNLQLATVPNYVADFWHVTSCDPVVISNGYAYVTLRGGNTCGSAVNRLDVIKLSADYTNNNLIESYPMNGPYGLGIDDQILFVCDGDAGLKVYNVEDKYHIDDHQIAAFSNINSYDVIPVNNYLFMIGDDGFYQYDYSDLQNIQQVSFIPVNSPH